MAILDRTTATTADTFHHSAECAARATRGPRGGIHVPPTETWRRNGATRTWKRQPERFEVPVKFGMYSYGRITDAMAEGGHWHTGRPESCELGALRTTLEAFYPATAEAL